MATANADPPRVLIYVLPAQGDQLALPQPCHSGHHIQRAI
jgi:hypothetical protein